MPYGCFVEFMPGKDGLLHISEIDWKRLETVEEAGIKEGDKIQVKLLEIDPKTGKFKLSHRVLVEKPEGYQERPARGERRERPERGERRQRPERNERGERRPRPERGERRERTDEVHEENHEPKDFTDELDKMDF
jgi:polyribonucleotide nucleotidyltransferase